MNRHEILKLVWTVKAHWSNFQVFEGDLLQVQVAAWLDLLSDIDFDHGRAAVADLDAHGREFAPTPGMIRAQALTRQGLGAPDFDLALSEAMLAARTVGRNGTPEWSHPAIGDAIAALGGWSAFCNSENPDAIRAHFRQAYETAATRADHEAVSPPVVKQLVAGLADRLALKPPEPA
jgi:hypothetical protein